MAPPLRVQTSTVPCPAEPLVGSNCLSPSSSPSPSSSLVISPTNYSLQTSTQSAVTFSRDYNTSSTATSSQSDDKQCTVSTSSPGGSFIGRPPPLRIRSRSSDSLAHDSVDPSASRLSLLSPTGADTDKFYDPFLLYQASTSPPNVGQNGSFPTSPVGSRISCSQAMEQVTKINEANLVLMEQLIVAAKTDDCGRSALHLATEKNNISVMQLLVEANRKSINATDHHNWTPLHIAAKEGHIEAVDFLLTCGSSVNAETTDSTLPIHYLVCHKGEGHVGKVLRLLQCMVDKGVHINHKTKNNSETPLHYACRSRDTDVAIIAFLIQNHANVNAVDVKGFTPLLMAFLARKRVAARLLLEVGADPSLCTKNCSCYDLAKKDSDLARILHLPSHKLLKKEDFQARRSDALNVLLCVLQDDNMGNPVTPYWLFDEPILLRLNARPLTSHDVYTLASDQYQPQQDTQADLASEALMFVRLHDGNWISVSL